MQKRFYKGSMAGQLKAVSTECRGSKTVKTKQVLMLVDDNGAILFSEEFRLNATKKAEKILLANGWTL